MKKVLLITLLVFSVLASSFAASDTEIMLGLSSGYNQMVIFPDTEGFDPETWSFVPLKADALFYFGDFALNTALGMDFNIPEIGDTLTYLSVDLLAYYKIDLGDIFDILVGGGINYKYHGESDNGISTGLHYLALLASARFQIEPVEYLAVFAGVDLGYNVMNTSTYSAGGFNSSNNLDANIMPWGVKAGVAYKF